MAIPSKRWGSPITSGSGGGGVNGYGTYENRPTAPSVGDTYAVISGVCAGDLFVASYSDTGEVIWRFLNRNHCNPFNSTGGWTQGNGGGANVGASTTTLAAPDSGIINLDTTGSVHDAEGPRIETVIPTDCLSFKFSVRALSRSAMTGAGAAFLFIRDATNSAIRIIGTYGDANQLFAGSWASGIVFPGAPAPWDGSIVYQIQYFNMPASPFWSWQVKDASGNLFSAALTKINFSPYSVGVIGASDGPASCNFTFTEFSFESYG